MHEEKRIIKQDVLRLMIDLLLNDIQQNDFNILKISNIMASDCSLHMYMLLQ